MLSDATRLARMLIRVFVPCQVNGTSLLGATHLEAVRSLRGIGDNLSLLVCDGFDPADVPAGQHAAWQASPVATINTAKSQSQESLEHDLPANERAYEDIRKEIKRQVGRRHFLFFMPFPFHSILFFMFISFLNFTYGWPT